ncbi:neuronal pentraxin-2-like isoform X2 [Cylas formicarius]|nr:neuronal pentraxin-2-like isoform X2 [Cylas formicarius]XP_060517360.1 neuronal pentraxin-2-like isoform X2 [Cylas formicarius]
MKPNIFVWLVFKWTLLLMKTLGTSVVSSYVENSLDFPSKESGNHLKDYVTVVSLTQKGYIQFLKYDIEVPEMNEYTFCLWFRSSNLSYSHPLLSYSRHEEERLIRIWISPHGKDINLEILQVPVFKIAYQFAENKWYHVCQSWSSIDGSWNAIVNKEIYNGFSGELVGAPIKSGGDVVVGQEYTDFDKGLDDGIEGDVAGFNLVRSAVRPHQGTKETYFRRNHFPNKRVIYQEATKYRRFGKLPSPVKSLGFLLVELSYRCGYLRGAPLSGDKVIVSWTKTPVRVFGGAILTNVKPFCDR